MLFINIKIFTDLLTMEIIINNMITYYYNITTTKMSRIFTDVLIDNGRLTQ